MCIRDRLPPDPIGIYSIARKFPPYSRGRGVGRVYEKWHICKCLVFHAENLVKVYTQKNSGYTKSRRKIRQQKIPKINSKFLHIEVLSREAWASKDTRFLTLSSIYKKKETISNRIPAPKQSVFCGIVSSLPVRGQKSLLTDGPFMAR